MNINEILTQAKAKGTEGIQTAVDDLWKIVREHEAAVGSAIDAYYAGAVKVEDTVKRRLNALTAQQRRINSEISAIGPALTQATISGDNAQLKQIQAKLSELEAQKAATATQIEMLSASQFPNDTRLYKEAAAHKKRCKADLRGRWCCDVWGITDYVRLRYGTGQSLQPYYDSQVLVLSVG